MSKFDTVKNLYISNPDAFSHLNDSVKRSIESVVTLPKKESKVKHLLFPNQTKEPGAPVFPLCMPLEVKSILSEPIVNQVTCPDCLSIVAEIDILDSYSEARQLLLDKGYYRRYKDNPQLSDRYGVYELTPNEVIDAVIGPNEIQFMTNLISWNMIELPVDPQIEINKIASDKALADRLAAEASKDNQNV